MTIWNDERVESRGIKVQWRKTSVGREKDKLKCAMLRRECLATSTYTHLCAAACRYVSNCGGGLVPNNLQCWSEKLLSFTHATPSTKRKRGERVDRVDRRRRRADSNGEIAETTLSRTKRSDARREQVREEGKERRLSMRRRFQFALIRGLLSVT